jgi:hypothetical protein
VPLGPRSEGDRDAQTGARAQLGRGDVHEGPSVAKVPSAFVRSTEWNSLTRLLLQRHTGEQVLDALVEGVVRIAVTGFLKKGLLDGVEVLDG